MLTEDNIGQILKRMNELETALRKPRAEAPIPGTWTPRLFGSTIAGTFTYDVPNTKAEYTLHLDRCYYNGRVKSSATAVAPTGFVSIGDLPFAAAASTNNGAIAGGCAVVAQSVNLVAGYTQLQGIVIATESAFRLYETGDNVAIALTQGGELPAAFDFYFWGMYKIA